MFNTAQALAMMANAVELRSMNSKYRVRFW